MSWYFGPAKITQGDRVVRVICEIDLHQPMIRAGDELLEGIRSWGGAWWDPDPAHTLWMDDEDATIRLDDGREGRVIIGGITIRNGIDGGTLRGNGAPPA